MSYKPVGVVAGLFALSVALVPFYRAFIANSDQVEAAKWARRAQDIDTSDVRLKSLSLRIQSLHGEGLCDRDDQCQVVGLGTPACGLFKDFLVYSTKDAQLPELLKVVEAFNEAHRALASVALSANQCGNKPAVIQCVNQRCSARSASAKDL